METPPDTPFNDLRLARFQNPDAAKVEELSAQLNRQLSVKIAEFIRAMFLMVLPEEVLILLDVYSKQNMAKSIQMLNLLGIRAEQAPARLEKGFDVQVVKLARHKDELNHLIGKMEIRSSLTGPLRFDLKAHVTKPECRPPKYAITHPIIRQWLRSLPQTDSRVVAALGVNGECFIPHIEDNISFSSTPDESKSGESLPPFDSSANSGN